MLARSASDPALLAVADQLTANFLWNGNDAVALRHGGTIVDVIGQIGVDPGAAWGSGDTLTADHTLRRKPSVQGGDTDGTNAFDPSPEWLGLPVDTFDGLGQHAVDQTVEGPNHSPVAADDTIQVVEDSEGTSVSILANDTDIDGDTLSVESVSDATDGDVTISPGGGAVVYVPDVDFSGVDSFIYVVTDGRGGTATGTVGISVVAMNDDPEVEDDAVETSEDIPATIAVLANDADVDGDPLLVVAAEGAENGVASVAPDGSGVIYAPDADFNGMDMVEVTVADGHGGVDLSELVVTVAAVNDPPIARSDLAIVGEGGSVSIDVLANDSPGPADEAGQALAVVSIGTPANGSAELIVGGPGTGGIRYTPVVGFHGADTFTYLVSDGLATSTGTVNVAIAEPVLTSLCSLVPTIVGTLGDDTILGTPGDDVIRGRRGNDVIDGLGGDDVICGGPGSDRITTHGGIDAANGGSGHDTIETGAARDLVRGGFGHDTLTTGPGSDRIAAGPGPDTVAAGDGDNRIRAGDGDDTVTAGDGNDRLDGGPGTDTCDAGAGRNAVRNCE